MIAFSRRLLNEAGLHVMGPAVSSDCISHRVVFSEVAEMNKNMTINTSFWL
jgi:hypothetical protein